MEALAPAARFLDHNLNGLRSTSSGAVLSSFYSDVVFFEGGGIPTPHYLILRQGNMFCAYFLNWLVGFSDK